jgi:hypothetical protein
MPVTPKENDVHTTKGPVIVKMSDERKRKEVFGDLDLCLSRQIVELTLLFSKD